MLIKILDYLYQINKRKSFSHSSCVNYCGKEQYDCSCKSDCLLKNNCCSDVDYCQNIFDYIVKYNSNTDSLCNSILDNCEFCKDLNVKVDNDSNSLISINDNMLNYKCLQCSSNYFLYNGKCFINCPLDTIPIKDNMICLQNNNCLTQDCLKCRKSNIIKGNFDKFDICEECSNGYFKYNNQCLKYCPFNLHADRISKVCIAPPVSAFYYIYPSNSSCKDNCNKNKFITNNNDCRCDKECKRNATCCYDIDSYC